MLFLQHQISKSNKFEVTEEKAMHYSPKCKNKQRNAIHQKISQILGLQILSKHKVEIKQEDVKREKYQLLNLSDNDEDKLLQKPVIPQNVRLLADDNRQILNVHPTSLLSPPVAVSQPRQRKLTPPPLPPEIFSFPSTQSNRKGKAGESRKCEEPQQVKREVSKEPYILKDTCINVKIGRMICRKYIPRLQMILEVNPECS